MVPIGKLVLVGGVLIVGGIVIYIKMKKSKESDENCQITEILSDEDRYKSDRIIIEEAIRDNDIETLEAMLHSSTSDFPDLTQLIKDAMAKHDENNKKTQK